MNYEIVRMFLCALLVQHKSPENIDFSRVGTIQALILTKDIPEDCFPRVFFCPKKRPVQKRGPIGEFYQTSLS